MHAKLLIIVVFILIFSILFLVIYKPKVINSCESNSAGGVVRGDTKSGCIIVEKSCTGSKCVAPILSLKCDEARDVCGKPTSCVCD